MPEELQAKGAGGNPMDRRHFLKATGTLMASAKLIPSALAEEARGTDGRMTLPMNRSWLYSRTVAEGSHGKDFDDSGYAKVVIPHTNVRLPWHSFDEKSYEFVSSYR